MPGGGRLTLMPATTCLRSGPGSPKPRVWGLQADAIRAVSRFRHGDTIALTLNNDLPVPLVLNWHGLDGVSSIGAADGPTTVSPGKTERFTLPLSQAGTFLCDARLLGDDLAQSSPARALIVEEQTPVEVDRDELLLIEDWRLRPTAAPLPRTAPERPKRRSTRSTGNYPTTSPCAPTTAQASLYQWLPAQCNCNED